MIYGRLPVVFPSLPYLFDKGYGVQGGGQRGQELRCPTDSEPDYTDAELEFILALEEYRRGNQRRFVTGREILRIAESLGYRKVAEPGPLPKFRRD